MLAAVWPISIFAKNFAPTVMFSLAHGAVYAAPVTLVVLPIAGWFLKYRPSRALIILPLIGTVSGIAVMWCWINFSVLPYGGVGDTYLMLAGLFGGLVAGAFFGHSVYRVAQ